MTSVTLGDVAARCGVSRATVSLVMQDSHRVSAGTKARVREALVEMGYVYDRRAANLRLQRTFGVGLLLTDIGNPALAELAMSIEDRAHDRGYSVMMSYSRDSVERQSRAMQMMIEQRLDGLVLSPAPGTTAADLAPLAQSRIPYVLVTRRVTGLEADYVGPDNTAAGGLIGEHLADLGVRTVAFVGGVESVSARTERMDGLRTALHGRGIPWVRHLDVPSDAARSGGIEGMRLLMRDHGLPDAVVGYSDTVATGIFMELRRSGLRAGLDIAVAGFDDSVDAPQLDPPLTSVATHMDAVGAFAADRLLERIEGSAAGPGVDVVTHRVAPQLHARTSTTGWAPPAGGVALETSGATGGLRAQ